MLLNIMNQQISLGQYADFFLRIILACVCGAVIGIERGHRLKEAGVRTHLLVSCTAALMIIISRELAVTSLRVVAMGEGKVLAADKSGKVKTFSQCIYCIIMLLHIENFSFIPNPDLIKTILIWIIVAITVYSGIDYFYKNRSLIHLTADK